MTDRVLLLIGVLGDKLDELKSICYDFSVVVEYDLLQAGQSTIPNERSVILELEALGVKMSDAASNLRFEAEEIMLWLHNNLEPDDPHWQAWQVVEAVNLYTYTFTPTEGQIIAHTDTIAQTTTEIQASIFETIEIHTETVIKEIVHIKDEIINRPTSDANLISTLLTENIDIIEDTIKNESDAFFNWFTSETAALSDPIISEASIMHNQIRKIAEDVVSKAEQDTSNIQFQIRDFTKALSEDIAKGITSAKNYIDQVAADIATAQEAAATAITAAIAAVSEKVEEVAKPLFAVKSKMIDYFMEIVVQVFEKLTSGIPDIKL